MNPTPAVAPLSADEMDKPDALTGAEIANIDSLKGERFYLADDVERLLIAQARTKKSAIPLGISAYADENGQTKNSYRASCAPQARRGDDLVKEVPDGFVLLQRHNGKASNAACMDGGQFHGWLFVKAPSGWVSQRKLEPWEVMQVEDQRDGGIVHETNSVRAG